MTYFGPKSYILGLLSKGNIFEKKIQTGDVIRILLLMFLKLLFIVIYMLKGKGMWDMINSSIWSINISYIATRNRRGVSEIWKRWERYNWFLYLVENYIYRIDNCIMNTIDLYQWVQLYQILVYSICWANQLYQVYKWISGYNCMNKYNSW